MATQLRATAVMAMMVGAAMAQLPPAGGPPPGGPPPGGPPNLKDPGNANGPPSAATSAPRSPEVVARSVPIDVAVELARAIVAACNEFHIGVAILDAGGAPKLYYVADGTGGTHAYTAYRKANTALSFNLPSGKVAAAAQADAAVAAKLAADPNNYVTWAGGLPIMAGNESLGAVGVSGAQPSAKDEACALEGLRTVQARLR